MSFRRSTLAFAAGTAVFLAVTVAVTAVLEDQIWPSAVVGLLVGAVAGVAALRYVRSRIDRAPGLALAVFGIVFLPVLAVLVLVRVRRSLARFPGCGRGRRARRTDRGEDSVTTR